MAAPILFSFCDLVVWLHVMVYIYIYIYIYIYHHIDHYHTVQVARMQVQYLRQWVDKKAPPVQVAEGEPPCVQVDYLR